MAVRNETSNALLSSANGLCFDA